MDNFADSFLGTLKKLRMTLAPDAEEEEEKKNHPEKEKEHGGSNSEHKKKTSEERRHHHGKHAKHLTPGESSGQPKISHTYESSSQGKDGTLLAIARHKPEGPNSETGKRTRSMRLAHSMNSVYRKIRNDKNIHNDRHYLVAVTEQIKEEVPQKKLPDK
ncbi:hypothetical protein ACHWQZ_G012263 [Mnemiopsis leidyi]